MLYSRLILGIMPRLYEGVSFRRGFVGLAPGPLALGVGGRRCIFFETQFLQNKDFSQFNFCRYKMLSKIRPTFYEIQLVNKRMHDSLY